MKAEHVTGDYIATLAVIHGWQLWRRTEEFWVFKRPDRTVVVTVPRTIYPLHPDIRRDLMVALDLTDADL